MKLLVRSALQWLADTRLARSVVEALFRGKARQRVVELDHQSVARSQNRTLLGLVHKAHTTRFGRDHDFRRIRNAGDFQRLVPLRTPAELWREYWQPAFPNLSGATWPGPIPYLAISSSGQTGPFPYIPVSAELWAAQQTAVLTALAFVLHARPQARFCAGRLFLLEGGTTLMPVGEPGQADTLEAIAIRKMPAILQPYTFSSPTSLVSGPQLGNGLQNGLPDDQVLVELAQRSAAMPVTCIAGTADRLERFFTQVKRLTGREHLTEIWPRLSAVLYARGSANPDRARLINDIGNKAVLALEMYFRPEGALALEDPRHGRLRLLPDHGAYFEFVPIDQIGKPRPCRYSAADVKIGVPYALAVSSPAGIWACLVGSVVCFERRDPPLLRLIETAALFERPAPPVVAPAKTAKPAFLAQPPHPRTPGMGAALPGRSFRTSSLARGDRG